MTTITIRTVGNPALYKHLRSSVASESSHRTASGAARRLLQIERRSKRWVETMGNWGHVEIEVDGIALDYEDAITIEMAAGEEMRGSDWDRGGSTERAVRQVLESLHTDAAAA